MTVFIGVYKAVYDYEPQTPEELAIKENDLLYLLAKSDIDEWWTVKKRILGADAEEPSGLVPSTYIEEAPVISHARAIYDYDQPQNPDEELLFHENDTFDVYDDKDPDWILVKSNMSNEVGFVPGNYIESASQDNANNTGSIDATTGAGAAAVPTTAPVTASVSSFLPPPQRNDRDQYDATPQPLPKDNINNENNDENNNNNNNDNNMYDDIEREDTPPPKPARPTNNNNQPHSNDHYDDNYDNNDRDQTRDKARNRVSYYSGDEDDYYNSNNNNNNNNRSRTNTNNDYGRYHDDVDEHAEQPYDDFYQTWNVQEIEGRKKHKAKLSIGNNKITFIPNKKNSSPEEWTFDKLVSYDNEKKHIFLEFVDPYKNYELHSGNNDTAKEIMSVIGEYKGASRGVGLKEVQQASKSKRKGKIQFDFIAESPDELSVKTGDIVYIINDKKSRDWWMCELVSSGKQGVVPAQFVEPMGGITNKMERSSSGFFNSIKKMAKNSSPSKSPSKDIDLMAAGGDWKDDAHQGISHNKKSRSRISSFSQRRKRSSSTSNVKDHHNGSNNANANANGGGGSSSSKRSFPDPKKSRLWVDRSGTFKVEAQFIGCADGKIHLHKSNGVKIAVAADKLSDDDLVYVERVTGFSLDKYRQKQKKPSSSSDSRDPREAERERRRRLREHEEKERDRKLRERELHELKKARQLLDEERAKLKEEKELPPIKPPRPNETDNQRTVSRSASSSKRNKNNYDWFEFFLNSGVDVSNCQRYTINFDREQMTEDMMPDINAAMLRTLGLREGDIVRVMKFLDNKFGRTPQVNSDNTTGGMFSQPDGALKVDTNMTTTQQPNVSQQLLPQSTVPAASSGNVDDDAWTARPAAKSQPELASKNTEFTGSMQDLLDLQPLEPKKAPTVSVPEPNLSSLEPVKTNASQAAPVAATITGAPTLVPLDPFKTGGNNILPMGTGFVMMPFTTGGLMPLQRTGGMIMPQTTFGAQLTGGILPVQKTSGGLIPIATTGGTMPQTSFGTQLTGGLMPISTTGGAMPQTSFGVPPAGSVLPLQKTATGLMPANTTGGGMLPLQVTGGMPATSFMNQNITGGAIPQTSFVNQHTGGAIPTTSFSNQLTGGAMPQPTFGNQLTGGAISQATFGNQLTGGAMPQATFGNQLTGGAMPQATFGNQLTGGALPHANTMPQTSFGGGLPLQRTGGFQPQSQFGLTLQRTGGIAPLPQNQLTGGALQMPQQMMNPGVNNITQGMQNTFITQPQQHQIQQQPLQTQALQTQPTGFGFGNAPQQTQQGQANIMNASVSNPFGFA